MRMIFNEVSAEGVLLVDATNAFNCITSVYFAHIINNTYQSLVRLIIPDSDVTECTTQGAISHCDVYHCYNSYYPSFTILRPNSSTGLVWWCCRSWHMRPENVVGWTQQQIGSLFRYYPNVSKTCFIVKPPYEHATNEIFACSGIKISTKGNRHLGAAL